MVSAGAASAESIPVELRETERGWQLLRDGERVSFGVGLTDRDKAHPDSGKTSAEGILLTRESRR